MCFTFSVFAECFFFFFFSHLYHIRLQNLNYPLTIALCFLIALRNCARVQDHQSFTPDWNTPAKQPPRAVGSAELPAA